MPQSPPVLNRDPTPVLTLDQSSEISRLASIMAMRRVRQFASRNGVSSNPRETEEVTKDLAVAAKREFEDYLTSLTIPRNTTPE